MRSLKWVEKVKSCGGPERERDIRHFGVLGELNKEVIRVRNPDGIPGPPLLSKLQSDHQWGGSPGDDPRRAKGAVPVQLQTDRDRVGRDGRAIKLGAH